MVLSGHQSSLVTFNTESFDSTWNFPIKQYVKEAKTKTKKVCYLKPMGVW